MNTVIWIAQILLALLFGLSGAAKIATPYEKLKANPRLAWVNDFSPNIVKLIGLLEVLAAVGLILPPLTGILPVLTPLAAVGLVIIMLGAAATHVRRGETFIPNLVLLLLAAFVVYGRFVAVPFV